MNWIELVKCGKFRSDKLVLRNKENGNQLSDDRISSSGKLRGLEVNQ